MTAEDERSQKYIRAYLVNNVLTVNRYEGWSLSKKASFTMVVRSFVKQING
jgi:hypothetical protein